MKILKRDDYISVVGWKDIAFCVIANDGDTITAIMAGDDKKYYFKPKDCKLLDDDRVCLGCGQIDAGERIAY